jgi:hypothetical protein
MARTDSVMELKFNKYITSIGSQEYDFLIKGDNSYLNWGSVNGSTGYGIRANAGRMEFKHVGGTWTEFGSGGGGISDGDKGDITVSSSGSVWTIDNDAITNAKLANMAGHTVKARIDGSSGDPQDLAIGSHSILGRNNGDISSIDANTNTILRRNTGSTLEFGKIGTNHLESTFVKNSIEVDSNSLQLVGDSATPGNSKYYGTDSSGAKGFFPVPSSGSAYVTMTSSQFKTAITSSTLPAGGYVKITNIGVTNLQVMCWCPSTNTFSSNVQVLNYDCDWGYMYIETTYGLLVVEAWDDIFGVVRNNAGTWQLITTGGHTSHRVSASSVSNLSTGDGPRITFQKTDYTDVGTCMSAIDDSYVQNFAFVGCSGGLLYAEMPMTRFGSIRGFVKYSGGVWQKFGPDASLFSVGTSGVYALITHPECLLYSGNATPGPELYCYTPCMSTTTTTRIGFRDGSTQITNPTVYQSQFYFERFYNKKFTNSESAVVNSNLWFHFKMMKKFN